MLVMSDIKRWEVIRSPSMPSVTPQKSIWQSRR